MGQFSWLYSDTGKQMIDDRRADSYLLVPPPFQDEYGEYILETCYDGYGRMGLYDIYDLIIEWNKEYIPEIIEKRDNIKPSDIDDLMKYYNDEEPECELRWLGIVIACYDKDNCSLPYPIKITSKPMRYDEVEPSLGDPNQGWETYDDDDDWW